MVYILLVGLIVGICEAVQLTDATVGGDKFDLLMKKIEGLERKNANLEQHMASEVARLNEKISELEAECKTGHVRPDNTHSVSRRAFRGPDDMEVAFFAVVSPHDVEHLGINQNIVFDQADTNIGNAYHPTHGIFTAPVDGTYVFFATVAGKHSGDNQDYYAHFDVNGRTYAKFVTFPNEQASQTMIVDLRQGDDVSIKNNLPDDHVLGSTFTTLPFFLSDSDVTGFVNRQWIEGVERQLECNGLII